MVNHLDPRSVVYDFCKHYFAHWYTPSPLQLGWSRGHKNLPKEAICTYRQIDKVKPYMPSISLARDIIWDHLAGIDLTRNGNSGCANEILGCAKCHFWWKSPWKLKDLGDFGGAISSVARAKHRCTGGWLILWWQGTRIVTLVMGPKWHPIRLHNPALLIQKQYLLTQRTTGCYKQHDPQ